MEDQIKVWSMTLWIIKIPQDLKNMMFWVQVDTSHNYFIEEVIFFALLKDKRIPKFCLEFSKLKLKVG